MGGHFDISSRSGRNLPTDIRTCPTSKGSASAHNSLTSETGHEPRAGRTDRPRLYQRVAPALATVTRPECLLGVSRVVQARSYLDCFAPNERTCPAVIGLSGRANSGHCGS
jgi:hypothetical protein